MQYEKRSPRGKFVLFSLMLFLLIPAAASAFSYTVTQHNKSLVGSSRHVNMAGTYTLTAGETSLLSVYIVTLDQNRNWLSSASGSKTISTWSAGVGDFALAYYYIEFRVATPTGTRLYKTPTYTW